MIECRAVGVFFLLLFSLAGCASPAQVCYPDIYLAKRLALAWLDRSSDTIKNRYDWILSANPSMIDIVSHYDNKGRVGVEYYKKDFQITFLIHNLSGEEIEFFSMVKWDCTAPGTSVRGVDF